MGIFVTLPFIVIDVMTVLNSVLYYWFQFNFQRSLKDWWMVVDTVCEEHRSDIDMIVIFVKIQRYNLRLKDFLSG